MLEPEDVKKIVLIKTRLKLKFPTLDIFYRTFDHEMNAEIAVRNREKEKGLIIPLKQEIVTKWGTRMVPYNEFEESDRNEMTFWEIVKAKMTGTVMIPERYAIETKEIGILKDENWKEALEVYIKEIEERIL